MGFQFRRSRKGVNESFSKRGYKRSVSVKSKGRNGTGDVTVNIPTVDDGSRGVRTTFNFGGGMRYVHYGKSANSLRKMQAKALAARKAEIAAMSPKDARNAKFHDFMIVVMQLIFIVGPLVALLVLVLGGFDG